MMTSMIWYYWCSYLESKLCIRQYVKALVHSAGMIFLPCSAMSMTQWYQHMRLKVLTPVLLRIQVFWEVMLCYRVSGSSYMKGQSAFHLEGQATQECLALKMKVLQSPETLETTQPMTLENLVIFQQNPISTIISTCL